MDEVIVGVYLAVRLACCEVRHGMSVEWEIVVSFLHEAKETIYS